MTSRSKGDISSKSTDKAASASRPPKSRAAGGSKKPKDHPHIVRVKVLGLAGVVVNNETAEGRSVLSPTKMRAAITISRDAVLQGKSHLSLPLSRSPNEDIVTAASKDDASSVATSSLVSRIRRGTGSRGFEVAAGEPAAVERYLAVWEQNSNSDVTVLTFETNLRRCKSKRKKKKNNGDEESTTSVATSMYAPKSFEVTIGLAPRDSKDAQSGYRSQFAFPLGVATLAISGDECSKARAPRQLDLPVLSLEQARPVVGPAANKGSNLFPVIDLASTIKDDSLGDLEGSKEEDVGLKDGTEPRKKAKKVKKLLSSGVKKLKRMKLGSSKMSLQRQREVFAKRYQIDSSGDAILRLSVEVFEKGSDPNKSPGSQQGNLSFPCSRRDRAMQHLEALKEKVSAPTPALALPVDKDEASDAEAAIASNTESTLSEPVRHATPPPVVPTVERIPDEARADENLATPSEAKNEADGQDDHKADGDTGNKTDNGLDSGDENGCRDTRRVISPVLTDEDGSRTCGEIMTTATETGTTLEKETQISTKALDLASGQSTTSQKSSTSSKKRTKKTNSQHIHEEDDDTMDTSPTFVTRQLFGQDVLVPAVAVEATEHLKTIAREARGQYSSKDRSPVGKGGSPTSQKSNKTMGLLVGTLMGGCVSPGCKKEANTQAQGEMSEVAKEERSEEREEQSRTVAESEDNLTMDTAGDGTMDTAGDGTMDTAGDGTMDTAGDGTMDTAGDGTFDTAGDGTMDTAGDETTLSRDEGTFDSSMPTRSISAHSNQGSPRGVDEDLGNVSEKSRDGAQGSKFTLKKSLKDSATDTSSSQQRVAVVWQTIADVLTCRLNSPTPIDESNEASYEEADPDPRLPPAINIPESSNVSVGELTETTFEYDARKSGRWGGCRPHRYEEDRTSTDAEGYPFDEPMQATKPPIDSEHGPSGGVPLPVAFGGYGLCASTPIVTYDAVHGARKVATLNEDVDADYHVRTSNYMDNAPQVLKHYQGSSSVLNEKGSNEAGSGGDQNAPGQILPDDCDATDDDKYTPRKSVCNATDDDKYTARINLST